MSDAPTTPMPPGPGGQPPQRPPQQPAPAAKGPWYSRKRVWLPITAVIAYLFGLAAGDDIDPAPANDTDLAALEAERDELAQERDTLAEVVEAREAELEHLSAERDTAEDDAEPEPTPETESEQDAERESHTLEAEGERNTDRFRLTGGDYRVTYDYTGDCFYGPTLEPADGGFSTSLPTGSGPVAGDDNLFGIDAGEYHINMITGPSPRCPWTITIEPT